MSKCLNADIVNFEKISYPDGLNIKRDFYLDFAREDRIFYAYVHMTIHSVKLPYESGLNVLVRSNTCINIYGFYSFDSVKNNYKLKTLSICECNL